MAEGLGSLPNDVGTCYRVRAGLLTREARKASPVLQALIHLSNVELAQAQEQDPKSAAGEEHAPIQLGATSLGICT